ncbi:MAG: hypothetical protein ABL951_17000, partial [Alphaproteobacteria bacterium]
MDRRRSGTALPVPLMLARFLGWLIALPRTAKLSISIILDAVPILAVNLIGVAGYELLCNCAFGDLTRYGVTALLSVTCCGIFYVTGLYRPMLRYRDTLIIFPVLGASMAAAGVIALTVAAFAPAPNLLALIGILWLGLMALMLAWRLIGGALLNIAVRENRPDVTRVAIYGAGRAGVALAEAMQKDDTLSVACFVDDDSQLHGRTLHGVKVRHANILRQLAARGRLDLVVLAIPSASPVRRAAIINQLSELEVRVETAPTLEEIISGWRRVSDIRAVGPEELLSREPVAPDLALLARELRGKSVLVTGGG